MAETQAGPALGTFCWNELMTTDVEGAKTFYASLFGWTTTNMDMGPGKTYTLFLNDAKNAGGCMKITPEMGSVPPHWMAYVSVPDVDATAKKVESLGGKLLVPPTDVPTVGRFIVFTDPAGAAVAAITSAS